MNNLNRFLSRYWCPFLLVAWFWSVSGLLVDRAYTVFLRPELGLLLVVALAVMMGFLFAEMRQWGHPRVFGLAGASRMLILLAPLVYMSVARGASLDSRAFQNRWTEMSGTNAVLRAGNEMGAMNSAASSNTAVEATMLDLTYSPARFKNQQIAVIGMIHRDSKIKERFGSDACLLFRFVVSCCAADARPVAILTGGDVPADWADDTWIRAEGRFTLRDDKGQPVPTLEISTATRIPKPRQPYLY
jgi:uncharacterized repeat protein (TIGR03943 family)